jgi:hypothetical protein
LGLRGDWMAARPRSVRVAGSLRSSQSLCFIGIGLRAQESRRLTKRCSRPARKRPNSMPPSWARAAERSVVRRHGSRMTMKRFTILLSLFAILAISTLGQAIERGAMWNGYVQRGKVKVPAGGSGWSVDGISVSHTEEIYGSSDMARYIFTRLRGKMRSASELVPNAGRVQVKVTTSNSVTRIAWVCGTDLHYLQSKSYAAAVALVTTWVPQNCN